MEFSKLAAHYQESLFRTIIPFWIKHSRDTVCGGYYNALTSQGDVFDTDKVIPLQAQQVWAFSFLYNQVDALPQWLELARHGADFLIQHGQYENRWLGVVDRRGRPVAPALTVEPACLVAMAFAQFYTATGEPEYADMAQQTVLTVVSDRQQQHEQWEEQLGGFRPLKHLREPMALLKALLETRSLLDPDFYKQATEAVINEIQNEFFDKRITVLRAQVLPGGSFCDSLAGRRLHGGYGFETANYLLEVADLTGNRRLAQQAVQMALHLADLCWDEPSGGFFQYADLKDRPSVDSEWDRKLWWIHSEALAIFSRGYIHTRQNDCLKWFRKTHEYTWQHFPDKTHQEWFAVLDRKGQPVVSSKATPEKGCYHLIRGLYETWRALESAAATDQNRRESRLETRLGRRIG
ncbi:N-acylglucosamine 2-epimerase [Larkinella arboricola]|uniref:N-acylglucosamine 2-epimerase n=1 Tax=Larkinella arboricola TaxID=643671 RepID=A0A327X082_LARAB|nr:AGE family epimerase/isomerase [Larkinella arboricola]RAJ98025.1 N-acylglucosamine 2-epimerase [Larkinella arboricola]